MSEAPAAPPVLHRRRARGCWLSLQMAATTTQTMESLPSGLGICTTVPDIFYLPELVSRPHQSGEPQGDLYIRKYTARSWRYDTICWYVCMSEHQWRREESSRGRRARRRSSGWSSHLRISHFTLIVTVRLVWDRMWVTAAWEKGHLTLAPNNFSIIYSSVYQKLRCQNAPRWVTLAEQTSDLLVKRIFNLYLLRL